MLVYAKFKNVCLAKVTKVAILYNSCIVKGGLVGSCLERTILKM